MHVRPYLGVLLLALACGAAGCEQRREPITFSDGTITIENQSSVEWRKVMITVNDHYRGGAPVLAPQGRMNAPISQFQTAHGDKYVVSRPVVKIEVAATDANGQPVRLVWGERK